MDFMPVETSPESVDFECIGGPLDGSLMTLPKAFADALEEPRAAIDFSKVANPDNLRALKGTQLIYRRVGEELQWCGPLARVAFRNG